MVRLWKPEKPRKSYLKRMEKSLGQQTNKFQRHSKVLMRKLYKKVR